MRYLLIGHNNIYDDSFEETFDTWQELLLYIDNERLRIRGNSLSAYEIVGEISLK